MRTGQDARPEHTRALPWVALVTTIIALALVVTAAARIKRTGAHAA